jgi:hypothetical protein
MRNAVVAACAALILFLPAAQAQEQARVMILGAYHFSGGGADVVNPDAGDVLSPQSQREIADVVSRLARFRPTKIAVEATAEAQGRLDADYAAYRAGRRTLSGNEIEQLGMRLAARLGHARVYAVDWRSGMDLDAAMAAGRDAQQSDRLAAIDAAFARVGAVMQDIHADRSLIHRLRAHNSPRVENLHDLYLSLAQLGSQANPAGANVVGGWYVRNLVIFSNIARLATPGERVLVIYGSGHLKLLKQFVDEADNLDLVDALDYLGRD